MRKPGVAPILFLLFGLLVTSPILAQPIPPNVKLNTDGTGYLQNEEQIWINLTDSLNVIADWRDFRLGYRRVGIGISMDGGATWTDQLVSPLIFTHQSDPCLVGDRTGRFFMNMLDYDRDDRYNYKSHIVVHTSTNKGLSWAPPVPIQPLGPVFEDKQFTAVDRTGGPYDGNYYVSWTRFPNPDRMIFVRSTDGGQTFDDTITVGPVVQTACGTYDQGQFSIPIVNSDGSVHVFWQGYDWDSAACTVQRSIRRARSTDGGATFTRDSVAFHTTLGYWDVDGNIDVYGMPNGDADISGGPYDGNIYIARTEYVSDVSDETNVVVHKSTDQGITWLDTVTINDDPAGQNIDQFHPWLIVNEDGTILTIFYDQRQDPIGHYLFDCYSSASFDGAETFIHNYRLSSVSSSPSGLAAAKNLAEARNPYDTRAVGADPTLALSPMAGAIAEYICVHAKHDYAVAVWTDTRDGTQDVYSTRFTIPFMHPRLYLPSDGFVTPDNTPAFRWSTCWHESEDAYRLEVASDSGFAFIEQTHDGLADNNFTPITALPDGLHYWRVKAFRSTGDSTGYSEVFQFTSGCEPGTPPLLTAPLAGDTVENSSLLLEWGTVVDAIAYLVQVSTDSGFGTTIVDSALVETQCFVSGLSDSTTYHWRVMSANACGASDWSTSDFTVSLCLIQVDGDVNASGFLSAADIIHLVGFVFKSGPPPDPCEANGDVNCSGAVAASDIIYMVSHVFKGGPPPCDICNASPLACQ